MVDKSAARIHSSVTFHAESPFVALFRLVHFGVTRFLRILRGTGRVDDGRVHNRSTPHQIAALFNDIVDGPKQLRSEFRFFHHVPEVQQCCGVGRLLLQMPMNLRKA